jgi:hypothetical protein
VPHENIDALEAVSVIPEPTCLVLLVCGLAAAPIFRRRFR